MRNSNFFQKSSQDLNLNLEGEKRAKHIYWLNMFVSLTYQGQAFKEQQNMKYKINDRAPYPNIDNPVGRWSQSASCTL